KLLIGKDARRLLRQQVVAGDIHLKGPGPLRVRQPAIGVRNRINSGSVHDNIQSAEPGNSKIYRFGDAGRGAEVSRRTGDLIRRRYRDRVGRSLRGGSGVKIRYDDVRALSREQQGHFAADSITSAH